MDGFAALNFKDEEVKKLMQNLKDGNSFFFFSIIDCFSHTVLSCLGDSLQQKHKIAQRKKLVSICMHFSSEMWEKDELLVAYILSDSLDFSKAICVHKKKAWWCMYSNYLLMVWWGMNRLTYDLFHLFSLNLFAVQRKLTVGKEVRILYNVLCWFFLLRL